MADCFRHCSREYASLSRPAQVDQAGDRGLRSAHDRFEVARALLRRRNRDDFPADDPEVLVERLDGALGMSTRRFRRSPSCTSIWFALTRLLPTSSVSMDAPGTKRPPQIAQAAKTITIARAESDGEDRGCVADDWRCAHSARSGRLPTRSTPAISLGRVRPEIASAYLCPLLQAIGYSLGVW